MRRWNAILVLFLGVLLLLMLTGCSRFTAAPQSVSVHEKNDSIREVDKERVVHIHDSIPFVVPVEKSVYIYPLPPEDTSTVETSLSVSTAYIDSNGLFHHSIWNKQQTIYKPVDLDIPVTDTTREEYHEKNDSETVYVSVPAELTRGQKVLIKLGWAMLAVVALGVVRLVRLFRMRFKPWQKK